MRPILPDVSSVVRVDRRLWIGPWRLSPSAWPAPPGLLSLNVCDLWPEAGEDPSVAVVTSSRHALDVERSRLLAILCCEARAADVSLHQDVTATRPIAVKIRRPIAMYCDSPRGFDVSALPVTCYDDHFWMRVSREAGESLPAMLARLRSNLDFSPLAQVVLVIRGFTLADVADCVIAASVLAAESDEIIGVTWRPDDGPPGHPAIAPYLEALWSGITGRPPVRETAPLAIY